MEKSKGKGKVIIAIIIIVLLVIAIGIGAYLYLATDVFKGNKELFFKYVAKNGEAFEMLVKDEPKEQIQRILQDKYTTEGIITYNLETNDAQIANEAIPVNNFSIEYNAKTDNTNNRESLQATLKYLTNDLFTLKYLRNDDLYALKSDEVINKYLAFDNNNLKEFASKMGITDTSVIPNKIETIDFEKLLSIDEETKNALITKFVQIINEEVSKENYKSQKDVTIKVEDKEITTTAYSLELSEKEIINIIIKLVNELKMNDTILSMIVEKVKIVDSTTILTIEELKYAMQEIESNLKSIEASEEKVLKLTVYVNSGNLIRSEISIEETKISIDYEQQENSSRMIILFEVKNGIDGIIQDDTMMNDEIINPNLYNVMKIEVANKLQDNEKTEIVVLTLGEGENTIKFSAQRKININESIKSNIIMILNITDTVYITAKVDETIKPVEQIEIEELTNENSAVINKFTPQYIMNLSQSIMKRLETLATQKSEFIKNTENTNDNLQNNSQESNNETVGDIPNETGSNTIENTTIL